MHRGMKSEVIVGPPRVQVWECTHGNPSLATHLNSNYILLIQTAFLQLHENEMYTEKLCNKKEHSWPKHQNALYHKWISDIVSAGELMYFLSKGTCECDHVTEEVMSLWKEAVCQSFYWCRQGDFIFSSCENALQNSFISHPTKSELHPLRNYENTLHSPNQRERVGVRKR